MLHSNNISDTSFASIVTGLLKNSKLRHLHYSMNELGHEGNAALLKLLSIPFPNQLKSLCLSNLKTTGKAMKVLPDNPGQTQMGAEELK